MSRAALLFVVMSLVFAGCASRRPAPVTDRTPGEARVAAPAATAAKPAPRSPDAPRPDTYTVKQGDTLYSIALDNGLDYRELAAWNNLENVAVIRVGQQLRLTAPTSTIATAPLRMPGDKVESRPLDAAPPGSNPSASPSPATKPGAAAERLKTGPKAVRVPYSEQAWAEANRMEAPPAPEKAEAKPEPKPEAKPEQRQAAREASSGSWAWPASGKIIGQYDGNTSKGIDIAGRVGDPIIASESGRVIFSGIGIRGLGKFVVIKHNDDYISVYAHQSEVLVKQDQTVSKGQKIGAMGNSDSDQVKLHFEIRRYGKPVDPLKLLPDRG